MDFKIKWTVWSTEERRSVVLWELCSKVGLFEEIKRLMGTGGSRFQVIDLNSGNIQHF